MLKPAGCRAQPAKFSVAVCEPEHQSLTDLTESLGISKATASSMTRFLMQVGFLERTAGPGDRRDYYRVSRKAWSPIMAQPGGVDA